MLSAVVGLLVLVSALGALTDPTTTDPVVADEQEPRSSVSVPQDQPPTPDVTTMPPTARETTPAASAEPDPDDAIAGAASRTALALLGSLAVKGRAPKTGYGREAFGSAWTDTNRNGCDTRNDVLRRDLEDNLYKPGTRGCAVLSGRLAPDPYTGHDITFVKGGASEVDIDHVVALSDAWQKGAGRWVPAKRLAFANDPLNLLAVEASANRQKGDGDAASWLPPAKSFRCRYIARQVAVKAKYRLWVTMAEREAMARELVRCPDLKAPRGSAPTIAPVRAPARRASAASTASAPAPGTATDRRYPFCKDLPPGYGPYYRGSDPEYAWYRDSDSDGVVCE